MHKPLAVIIFGSPGSGKSTQGQLLAQKYGCISFDTGKYIERFIYDPKTKATAAAKKVREEFESGKLVDPSIVLDIMTIQLHKLINQHESVVFSGSPRTEYEAFGKKSKKGVMDILAKAYGKERIYICKLDLPEEIAAKRNRKRLLCSVCKTPLLSTKFKRVACPFCGGKLYKRSLDVKGVIGKRFKEYETRTSPIFTELKKRGFVIHTIPATPLPYKIFQNISKKIDRLVYGSDKKAK